MEAIPRTAVMSVVEVVMQDVSVRRATRLVSPKLTVTATRRSVPRKGANVELVLTMGRPNYANRQVIKDCLRAGEPFPVKKLQLQRA